MNRKQKERIEKAVCLAEERYANGSIAGGAFYALTKIGDSAEESLAELTHEEREYLVKLVNEGSYRFAEIKFR